MSKLKKLTQQQLFLPIFCMILVLCVNMIYDVSQGRDFMSSSKSESRTSCSAAVW